MEFLKYLNVKCWSLVDKCMASIFNVFFLTCLPCISTYCEIIRYTVKPPQMATSISTTASFFPSRWSIHSLFFLILITNLYNSHLCTSLYIHSFFNFKSASQLPKNLLTTGSQSMTDKRCIQITKPHFLL